MSKKRILLPLDSFRLAQYSVDVHCFICDGGNTFDADRCRHCQAPMALTSRESAQAAAARLITALGAADAGKTVYLGMLTDLLSRQNDQLQMLARGAFSVSLQQRVMADLAACRFPPPTEKEPEHWNWVHGDVRLGRSRRVTEVALPDISGEALVREIDHPRSLPMVRALLEKSRGLLLMLDAERLELGDESPDFFAMKAVSYLCELAGHRRKGWPNRPVALVFTKADHNEACFGDPLAYARERTPGVWQQCRDRLRRFKFFAAGVAGASAVEHEYGERWSIPLRIEPRGIVPPFAWLLREMK